MMGHLSEDISARSFDRITSSGSTLRAIHDRDLIDLSTQHRIPVHTVFVECLSLGITPLRYLRNQPSISLTDQLILARSVVAVVGCGGLGGHVIESLTRLGLGRLLIFDPDRFDETNLNRQIFCDGDNVGNFKVDVAARRCGTINPAVTVVPTARAVRGPEDGDLFTGCDVMVDALDNGRDRLGLAALARERNLPLVHGAVSGFEGRFMIIRPGSTAMETLYAPENSEATDPAEVLLGTPMPTPAVIAGFQVMAVLTILLKRSSSKDGPMVHADLMAPSLNSFTL
jgi:molybdopterin/thiamine biosynthesis adenylyltransferase